MRINVKKEQGTYKIFVDSVLKYESNNIDLIFEMAKVLAEGGCSYCRGVKHRREGTDICYGNKLYVGYGIYRTIKYCPMCGRKI